MTVPYLGPGWGKKALALMRTDPRVQEAVQGVKLRLLTRILDAPEGRYGYLWADFDGTGLAEGRMGHAGDGVLETLRPTVTLEGDYAVFAAIQRGETTERKAFLSGRLKLHGSRIQALRHMGALEAVTGALAEIPCET
ncbi:MAG TPA: SCP2 sterol-binding domain-containing protein [Candidatus Thermoplasmatota archaeon]|nr:SCP2 sterol-binding domain-containing protein [Candidatus Thermoplasmatota archaeon]